MKPQGIILFLLFVLFVSCDKEDDSHYQDDSSYIVLASGDSLYCSFQKYMSLQPVAQGQGGACYEDYFIQGYNTNEFITIYNLKEKRNITTLSIPSPPPNSKIHANTINFGGQRYDEKDYFPLLYISSGYSINGISYVYVYRIEGGGQRDDDLSVSLVQTISLKNFGSWTEGIIDAENGYLWIKYSTGGQLGFAKYDKPDIVKSEVTVQYEDYLQNFNLEPIPVNSSNQGHLFADGRILLVSGIPSEGQSLAFILINSLKEKYELILDLSEVGLHNYNVDNYFEPENLFFYNNQLMIGYRNVIYILNIQKVKNGVKTNYFS
jgi:hypothetical protein